LDDTKGKLEENRKIRGNCLQEDQKIHEETKKIYIEINDNLEEVK